MGIRFQGQEEPLEDSRATHSSILVWRIPWTEEPGRLQSMGSQRVRHDWSNLAHMHSVALHVLCGKTDQRLCRLLEKNQSSQRLKPDTGEGRKQVNDSQWNKGKAESDIGQGQKASCPNKTMKTSRDRKRRDPGHPWLSGKKICLLMQETQVWSLVWEDPTRLRATKSHVPQLLSLCSRAQDPQLRSPHASEPVPYNRRSHRNEKYVHRN